jgi:glutathione peroxidase
MSRTLCSPSWLGLVFAVFGACQSAEPTRDDPSLTEAENEPMSESLYDQHVFTITGQPLTLSEYRGKVLLFVNVASECGFTRQYTGLQELWDRYRDDGLVVLGFPANDFGGQEPGTDEEIQAFCSNQFGVTFPMFSKISVIGDGQHPLYRILTSETGADITWNFNKILVDRQGRVIRHFLSPVEPLSDELVGAIEEIL